MKDPDHSSEGGTAGTPGTSLTLLQLVQRGDPAGWRRLCAVYTPLVRWWCHRRAVRHADAEDVVQDVFVTVLGKVRAFARGGRCGSFRAWLREITSFKVMEYLRKVKSQPAAAGGSDARDLLAQLPEPPPIDEETEQSIVVRAALEEVRGAVESRTWEAAARTLLGGETPREAAAALGLSLNAVYIARSRVLAQLRVELAGLLD